MTGMSLHHEAGLGAVAGFMGTWMAMMVPMMLPSLVPMLSRYRRSVGGAGGVRPHRLTAVVAVGYFAVWAILGVAVHAAGAGLTVAGRRWATVADWLPVAAGFLLLVAGGVQLTSWKARQLASCREAPGCDHRSAPDAQSAWRHGLELGVRCTLCCGSLMLALLAVGMMDLGAMAAVTLAISAERLGPVPLHIARVTGAGVVLAGVLRIAGA